MLSCLDKFISVLGGMINSSKSSLFFLPRVPLHVRLRIKEMTHMQISNDIGRYMGFPLSWCRRKRDDFQYIIDRVRVKLSNWKANCLSIAGRITLAKAVVSAIPMYPMQVAKLPMSVCLEVERL